MSSIVRLRTISYHICVEAVPRQYASAEHRQRIIGYKAVVLWVVSHSSVITKRERQIHELFLCFSSNVRYVSPSLVRLSATSRFCVRSVINLFQAKYFLIQTNSTPTAAYPQRGHVCFVQKQWNKSSCIRAWSNTEERRRAEEGNGVLKRAYA